MMTGAGLIGAIIGPLIGILGGAFGAWVSIRNTRSPRERQFMIRQGWIGLVYALLFMGVLFAFVFLCQPLARSSPAVFWSILGLLVAAYGAGLTLFILRGNRRQRQIQVEDGTAGMVMTRQQRPLSRRQQLWTVYGSLGGSTVGVLAWMVVLAGQAEDWITVGATVLFGVGSVLGVGRAWMRHPEQRFRAIAQILALLGLFTLVMSALHWRDWTEAGRDRLTAGQGVFAGSALVLIALIVEIVWWLKRRRAHTSA